MHDLLVVVHSPLPASSTFSLIKVLADTREQRWRGLDTHFEGEGDRATHRTPPTQKKPKELRTLNSSSMPSLLPRPSSLCCDVVKLV
jgi:hypothetical protein